MLFPEECSQGAGVSPQIRKEAREGGDMPLAPCLELRRNCHSQICSSKQFCEGQAGNAGGNLLRVADMRSQLRPGQSWSFLESAGQARQSKSKKGCQEAKRGNYFPSATHSMKHLCYILSFLLFLPLSFSSLFLSKGTLAKFPSLVLSL